MVLHCWVMSNAWSQMFFDKWPVKGVNTWLWRGNKKAVKYISSIRLIAAFKSGHTVGCNHIRHYYAILKKIFWIALNFWNIDFEISFYQYVKVIYLIDLFIKRGYCLTVAKVCMATSLKTFCRRLFMGVSCGTAITCWIRIRICPLAVT